MGDIPHAKSHRQRVRQHRIHPPDGFFSPLQTPISQSTPPTPPTSPPPRLPGPLLPTQGRGFGSDGHDGFRGTYESNSGKGPGPAMSVEGWVVCVTGVHEEAQEEDFHNEFGDFGEIKNLHMNLDRKTGFVKGYCLIEFPEKADAQRAIDEMDGKDLLGKRIHVDWAFMNHPRKGRT